MADAFFTDMFWLKCVKKGAEEYVTAIQEKAFEMIRRLPEDKVYYLVKMLEGIEGLVPQTSEEAKTTEQKAYENLQRFRKCSNVDIDYKAELVQALEEKYAGID